MTFKISTPDGTKLYLHQVKYLQKRSSSTGFFSVSHCIVAMYEQENVRNNEPPNCSRLKTRVRRHVDQTMRTRNFKARNERVERGVVTKSRKGEKSAWRGKWESAISGKQLDNVPKENYAVPVMIEHLETGAIRDTKGQSYSPAPKAQTQIDGKKPSKGSGLRGWSPSGKGGRIADRHFRWESVRTHHVIVGAITSLNQDANMAKNADSDTLRLMGSPEKSRRKIV